MQRQQALLAWTQKVLNDDECYLKPASSDASFRSYLRVFSKGNTYIVMDAPPEHENCLPFIDISKRLIQCGVLAPEVLNQNLEEGFLLLTDLGNKQYLDELNESNFQSLYSDAIQSLHTIQNQIDTKDLKPYDKELLSFELSLFRDWFIKTHLGFELSDSQEETLANFESLLIENALNQPQVFVHRDFHSRNLMVCNEKNPGIIDFQDAVMGPATYDLVSLLRDCYIHWENDYIYETLDNFRLKFNSFHNQDHSFETWSRWFDLMGMQRHMKAIGIFCRLNYRDKKPGYLKDIHLTLNYLKSMSIKYPEFESFSALLNDISPCMEDLCKP